MENRRSRSIDERLVAVVAILTLGLVCDVQATSPRQVVSWQLTEADIPKTATAAHQAALRRTFSKKVDERERGANILSNIGRDAPVVIPFLIRLLADDELVQRDFIAFADVELGREARPSCAAGYALLWIGQTAVPALVQTLQSPDAPPQLKIRSAGWLGSIGDCRAVLPLIAATGAGDKDLRWVAVNALGELHDRRAVQCMLNIAQDPSQELSLRKTAIRSLGEIGAPSVVSAITKIACDESESPDLRPAAIQALGELGDRASLPVLLKLVDSTEGDSRTAAVFAIRFFSSQTAVDRLVALLETPGEPRPIRTLAASGLAKSKDPAVVSRLLRYLGQNDARNRELRYYATAGLAASNNREVLNFVCQGLEAKGDRISQASVDGLLRMRSVRAVPVLTAVVKDRRWFEDEMLQIYAYFALSQIRAAESVDALVEVARDSGMPLVSRLCAIRALGQLRLDRAIPQLANLAGAHEVEIRRQVAAVLGDIGSQRASPILRKALNDSDKKVRAAAKYSLVSLGEEP